ncbi:MAG: SH3 domain-containing protein [Rhizobiaceae bacterium]|nr:SH3 domain-containing protein [Rhizobiaceae bacterium]
MRKIAYLLLIWTFATLAHADEIDVQRVRFPAGQTGTTIEAAIKGYSIKDYILGANAGQRMTVSMKTSNGASYFNVLPANSETAIFVGSTSGNNFEGVLPANGDYRIRVYLMRSAARRNETAKYTLSIAIHGGSAQNPAPANPDYADGLSGGPDFWQVSGVPANDALNIRSGPSASSRILISVPNGTVFRNLGCKMAGGQRWCQLQQPDRGVRGWAAGRYLREAAAPATPRPPAASNGANVDQKACLQAVAKVTSNDVTVLSYEFSEANSEVIIGVGPNRARWRCLVSRGRVADVMSLTDEGAL